MAYKFPEKVLNCPINKLHMAQIRIMGDWLAVRHRIEACKKRPEVDALMLEVIKAQPERAQEAYEVVVLLHKPGATAKPATDNEKRFLELTTSVAMATLGDVDARCAAAVSELTNAAAADFGKLAKKAIAEAADRVAPIVIKEGTKTRKVKGVLPPEFKRMVELGGARKNIMLVGPAGCGKTYLAEKLAEALGLDFADQSCSAGLSESAFTGWLLPVGKGGQFDYVESPFIRIYENGGVFLFDEMDAADANLLTFLNKALANDGFHLPQRFGKTLVKKSKNFVALGACNTFGHGADAMYVGRNQLDAATLDRFRVGMITMDYSATVEEAIVDESVLAWGRNIRKKIRDRSLRRVMSTRTMKDMTDMVHAYKWQQPDWDAAYFADWTNEERSLVAA